MQGSALPSSAARAFSATPPAAEDDRFDKGRLLKFLDAYISLYPHRFLDLDFCYAGRSLAAGRRVCESDPPRLRRKASAIEFTRIAELQQR